MTQDERRSPLLYLFSKAWQYSAENRRQIKQYWLMFIVANSLSLFAQPIVWAKIIDAIQLQGITVASMRTLLVLLVLTLVIDLVFWMLHGPARYLECNNAFGARAKYRSFLLNGFLRLPLEWHAEHHSGDTSDKINKGSNALHEFSGNTFQVINGIVRLIGSYCMLAYFSPPAAAIVALMVLATGWITIRFDRVLIDQYREINHADNNISESVIDVVTNISTVVILRVEQLVFSAIMHKVEKPFELVKRNNRTNEWKWFLTNMCCTLMTILVLGTYFWQHLGTEAGVLVGNTYIMIRYLSEISQLFFNFTQMYGDMVQQGARVRNAEELAGDFEPGSLANHRLPDGWRNLEIKALDFSYHGEGADLHLEQVSLSMTRGEHIAFVGETGSGKTTLLKIIRELYHPQHLELLVDGETVASGFEGISRAIALVPQHPEIFTKTILENITMGAELSLAFVQHFTDMACFTDVIRSLPHGLNSSIKEKGVNLSGGQQQRLALARGLLGCHDKDIVLLDEPTSSLDAITEMRIYENIFREFVGKTVISSIHRLHLLPLFDRICVFEKGKIVASGTLAELLISCPSFKALWETVQYT